MIYTVEEHYSSYNDWYELIWTGNEPEEALKTAKESFHSQLRISSWSSGERRENWIVKDGEIIIFCDKCCLEKPESQFFFEGDFISRQNSSKKENICLDCNVS